jgi:hypothetical protein
MSGETFRPAARAKPIAVLSQSAGREARAGVATSIAQAVANVEPCEETARVEALLREIEAGIARIDRKIKVAELRSKLVIVRRLRGEP